MIRFFEKGSYPDMQDIDGRDRLRLDQDIWNNVRERTAWTGCDVVSVLDEPRQREYLAYEDTDADREMRMLRELKETKGALQFPDIYPGYRSVKIYGFNELAYAFVKYLEMFDIPIEVDAAMWKGFYEGTECRSTECDRLTIYAEGVDNSQSDWPQIRLTSVSVEFECIDRIYMANVKEGIIRDAVQTGDGFLERLKSEKEVVIIGTGVKQLDAYDLLCAHGIDICCFMDDRNAGRSMFGKRILGRRAVRRAYKRPVFINCDARHSAWGMGGTDQFDLIGYRRNEQFFLLRDHMEIEGSGLKNIIRDKKIALAGDIYLCRYLYAHLEEHHARVVGYLDTSSSDMQPALPVVLAEDIDEDTTVMLVVPELFNPDSRKKRKDDMEELISCMKSAGIKSYTDYFSYTVPFIDIAEGNASKYPRKWLMPKRIVLGAIEGACGNTLFRGSLDDHPAVMLISEYNYLNNDLMWICIRLSVEPADDILPLFWRLYGNEREQSIYDRQAFDHKMEQLLRRADRFTAQELFVIIHMAYMYMIGKDVSDARDMVIYWEPHTVPRDILEGSVRWLGVADVPCDIVNIVRNICVRNGSIIKECIREQWGTGYIFYRLALSYPDIDKKDHEQSGRIVIRFETLKKHPRQILDDICARWDIPWSDTLMATTYHGKSSVYDNGERLVKDFDLDAVYKTYDEYFSEFDKFRLSLINAPWQKKYGYPYVDMDLFSRRELQQMFLKGFYFEGSERFQKEKADIQLRLKIQALVRERLQKARVDGFYLGKDDAT